jgi:hypothetical protein
MRKLFLLLLLAICATPASAGTVALSGRFTWDTGAAIEGTVILIQVTATGDVKVGHWSIGRYGAVSASVALQDWGTYRFELRDLAGNLIARGTMVAFPTLQSGQVNLVISQAQNHVKSARFVVAMGDLATAAP